jgi:hypothetical protein
VAVVGARPGRLDVARMLEVLVAPAVFEPGGEALAHLAGAPKPLALVCFSIWAHAVRLPNRAPFKRPVSRQSVRSAQPRDRGSPVTW